MLPTISAFSILVLILVGEGLSIARLVIRYKYFKNKELERLKAQKDNLIQAENQHL